MKHVLYSLPHVMSSSISLYPPVLKNSSGLYEWFLSESWNQSFPPTGVQYPLFKTMLIATLTQRKCYTYAYVIDG